MLLSWHIYVNTYLWITDIAQNGPFLALQFVKGKLFQKIATFLCIIVPDNAIFTEDMVSQA